ncbi:PIN domain-containing protein [Dyadobacter bucti]|uniref:PIN domain-containing protein n=1 Tax=Dyadobacter bucti TaxID=2572203 RepID=UPI001107BA8D|nr:PIN domain-containing protein [Dyadobacter bucti]
MSNIRAVVDTNVLIRTINRTNFDFFIYEAFSNERFDWVVSTAILDEYEEN